MLNWVYNAAMLRLARNIVVAIITFWLGVGVVGVWVYRVSLEDISRDVSSYDGKVVAIETYARIARWDEDTWAFGEQFEKYEVWAYAENENIPGDLTELKRELAVDYTDREYNRVRVLVTGRLHDNCGELDSTCCFGRSVTLDVRSMTQLGPVERYREPVPPMD